MTNSIFDRFSSTDTASVQRKQRKQKQGRILRIEELENRELLSATPWNMAAMMPSSSSSSWDDSTDANTQVIVSSASASVMSAASAPVLEAPTGLTATDIKFNSITLEWNEANGATEYEVWYCHRISGDLYSDWTTISGLTDTTFIISDLQANTWYSIYVRAVAGDQFSDWSSWTYAVTPSAPRMPAPVISAVDATPTSLTISWNPVEGAASYQVGHYEGVYGSSTILWTSEFAETSVVLSGLRVATHQTFIIRAFSEDYSLSSERQFSHRTLSLPPSPTLSIKPDQDAVTDTSVALNWTAVTGATHYGVRYRVGNGGEWSELTTVDTSLVVTGLDNNTVYQFYVYAGYDGELGSWNTFLSSVLSVTTVLPTPTGLAFGHTAALSTTLIWTAVKDAERYELRYRSGTDEWTSVTTTATSTTVFRLTSGTTYEFQIRTASAARVSVWSDSVWVTIPTTAPSTTVTQSWGGSVAIVGSTLEIQGTDYSDWIEIQQTSTSIIVHSFCEQRIDRTGIWSFDTEGISQIAFWGFGGNDVFIGAYEGVSTTITMRLDGGGGDNWLVGGAGNDWIYGGWLGNSHLDTGVSGDSVVIGGEGANVFYNTSDGSQCFIWVGTGDVWANAQLGDKDGWLRMVASRPSTGATEWNTGNPSVSRPWLESEVLQIGDYVQRTYDVIGNYAFFRIEHRFPNSSDKGIDCTVDVVAVPDTATFRVVAYAYWVAGHIHYYGLPTFNTFVHEVSHLWHVNTTPAWTTFSTFSSGLPIQSDYTELYGIGNSREDWATTVAYRITDTILGEATNGQFTGSSSLWLEKLNVIESFFDWLNPNRERPTLRVAAPRVLTGAPEDNTTDSIRLRWTAVEGATKYEIRYYSDGELMLISDIIETSATITGLSLGTTYRFQIRAILDDNVSHWSPHVSRRMEWVSVPTGLRTIDRTSESLTLSWNEVADATGYEVEYCVTGTTNWILVSDITEMSLTIDALPRDTNYTIRVRGVNDYGASSWSSTIRTTTLTVTIPTKITVINLTFDSITLEWDEANDVKGYEVEYRVTGTTNWILVSDITETSVTIDGLQQNTDYTIRVRGVNDYGISSWSSTIRTTTPSIPAPTGLTAIDATFDSITIEWNEANGATEYEVWYSVSTSQPDWTVISGITNTTFTVDGLQTKTAYIIYVRAVAGGQFLGWSRMIYGYTLTAPIEEPIEEPPIYDPYDTCDTIDVPSGVIVTGTSFDSIGIRWNEVSDATMYEVRYRLDDSTVATQLAVGTWVVVDGFQAGTTYEIQVRTVVVEKSSDWSPLVYATTLAAPKEEPTDEPSVEKPPIDEPTDEPSVDIPPVEEPIEEEPPVEEEPAIDIPVAPSAPTDMRIDESSPYSVVLQWTQSDEVSSYVLEYRRTSDTEGEWIEITAPVAAATSVRIEGLKPVTQYTFRLTAVNEAGTAATEMTAATTANPDALLPVKPRVRLDKKATTTTSLTINLLAPNSRTSLDANVHYTISWSPTARNSTAPSGHIEGVTGTQFTLVDLNPGTRYRITVTPHNENGQSHDSRNRSMHTTVNATTQRYDTLRVQKLRSDNSLRTADSLTFTWQQSRAKHVADAVVHYRIEVLDRTTGQTVMQTTTTDLRFTLTELDANTRYTIRVQEVATIDGRDILSRIAQLTARTLRLV